MLFIAVVVSGIGWWVSRDHGSKKIGKTTSPAASLSVSNGSPASASQQALEEILAIDRELERIHCLTQWAAKHSPEEIVAVIHEAASNHRPTLYWLLQKRYAQLYPTLSEEERRSALAELTRTQPESIRRSGVRRKPGALPIAKQNALIESAVTDPEGVLKEVVATPMHPNARQELLEKLIERVAAEDPEQAIALAQESPHIPWLGALRDIMVVWVEDDPHAAYAWIETMPDSSHKRNLTYHLLSNWSRHDLESAIAVIADHPVRSSGFTRILTTWFEKDPVGSAQRLLQTEGEVDADLIGAVATAVASHNPELAAQLLDRPMRVHEKAGPTVRLVREWTKQDPAAARQYMDAQPRNKNYYRMAEAHASSLAANDPVAAKTFVESLPTETYSGEIDRAVAQAMSDRGEALQWLLTRPASKPAEEAVEQLAADQSVESLEQLSKGLRSEQRSMIHHAMINRLAGTDPQRALSYLSAWKSEGALVEPIIASNIKQLAEADSTGVMDLGRRLPEGAALDAVARAVARRLHESQPVELVEWLNDLPGESTGIASQYDEPMKYLAAREPEVAARLYDQIEDPRDRYWALRGAVEGVATRSFDEAATFLERHVDPNNQEELLRFFGRDYMSQDVNKASRWVQRLSHGPIKDAALHGAAENLYERDPSAALRMVAQGSNAEARRKIFGPIGSNIRKYDKAKLKSTIHSLAIPQAEKQALLDKYKL